MKKESILLLISIMMILVGTAAAEPAYLDFVHYTNGSGSIVSPDNVAVQGRGYDLLGFRWKGLPAPFFINPETGDGLENAEVIAQVQAAFTAWDDKTSRNLFSYRGTTGKDTYSRDRKNTVFWAGGLPSNVIARTRIWYNPARHKILETDIAMNRQFTWGIDPDGEGPGSMPPGVEFDIRDIVTHEAGHVWGLADLYSSGLRNQTMYGYSEDREVKKISLEPGDVRGLRRIYGA